jgi:prepilin-type N-terminal cleavage/methylation domain-containing protein
MPRRAQRGVTLIEVMLSMAVVLVGMLALFRVLSVASAGSQQSQRFSQALARAQLVIEAMRRAPPTVLQCLATTPATSWTNCETLCRTQWLGAATSPQSCIFSTLANVGLDVDGTNQSYVVLYDANNLVRGSSFVTNTSQFNRVYDVQLVVGFSEDNSGRNPLPQASTCAGRVHCVTLRTSIYRDSK